MAMAMAMAMANIEKSPHNPFSCAATRSANGLPGHPNQAGGGVQAIQGRHGIVDPGPAASHKGRTAVLDPAGAIRKRKTKKKIWSIVFRLRSVLLSF